MTQYANGDRALEERLVDGDTGAPYTEWEPALRPEWALDSPSTKKDWNEYVRKLNKLAKSKGSFLRYRSIEVTS